MAGLIFDNSNSDISAEIGSVTINGLPIASSLDGLADVVITGVADNEVLAYNTGTSQWINQTADEAGLVDIASTQTITGAKTFTANTTWTDDDQVRLGTGGDLRLYHDGSDSFIENVTGGFGISTALGNMNFVATTGSVNIDAGAGVDIDAPDGLFVDNNIEITGAGWGIFPNRVGVGTVPNVTEAAGAALQVVGSGYISVDLNMGGAVGFINAGGVVENVISASGTPDEYARIRNFVAEATLWEVRSRSGTVGTADREATLALTRTDEAGNEEFLDLFNNGYASLSDKISEAYGIRIQKRGTGVYRPFYFDWYDGTTVTDGLDVLSSDDSGGPLFRFQQRLTTVATSTTRAGFNVPHGTAPTTPVDGDVWTTTAGVFVRINGATVGPLIDAGTSAGVLRTDTTVINFNTASPVTLFTTPTNCMIKEVTVIIDTSFNDAAATLSVGINGGANNKYMTTGGNDLDAAATSVFTTVNGNPAASAEALEAYLTPGTATQGSVRVVIVYYVQS